jgi:hypothetical protein
MMLHASERPAPTASRIHGPRKVLGELVRLRGKVERAYLRASSVDERAWCRSVADALDPLIRIGPAVVTGGVDPRPARRVRKSKRSGTCP